jgi:hypothetical protein
MNLKMVADHLRLIADSLEDATLSGESPSNITAQPATDQDALYPTAPVPPIPMRTPATQPAAAQPAAAQPAAAQPAAAQPAALNLYAGTALPVPPVVTREDVITRFTAIMQAHGQDAVIALLKARGLSRVSEATPKQLATLYQDAGAML